MMTLIAAAALAAQPAAPAPVAPSEHEMHMKMGEHADHKGMDCCMECCKEMEAKMKNGQSTEHSEHNHQ